MNITVGVIKIARGVRFAAPLRGANRSIEAPNRHDEEPWRGHE